MRRRRGAGCGIASVVVVALLAGCGGRASPPPVRDLAASVPTAPTPGAVPTSSPVPAPGPPKAPSATLPGTAAESVRSAPSPLASPAPTPGAGARWLPHWTSEALPAAQLAGVDVVTDGDRSCVWLLTSAGERVAALWPPGYRVRFAPLRVHDERDRLVWQEGTPRTVDGGYSQVQVERLPERCRTGRYAWWVGPLSG